MTDTLIHDRALRLSYRFTSRTPERLVMDNFVEPGGGVTPHVHPTMEERFEVIAGRAEILSGRKWITAGPGDVVVIPPGTRHAFRNTGKEVAHVRCEASPPETLQEFLEEVAELSREGAITSRGLPTSLSAFKRVIVIARRHRHMVELLFPPAPPRPVQKLLFSLVARGQA
jgi:mannose-6-phosphate isomerase-like protein (cupin superfamily)